MRALASFVLTFLAISLSACATINAPIDGVVIDTTTGKPIPGAFVIAQWIHHGSDGFGSRTTCPHVDVVQADASGRYKIPEEPVLGLNVERQVFSYKPGYEWFLKEPYDEKLMTMRPFEGTVQERLDKLLNMTGLECGEERHYRDAVLPFYKALQREASLLTPEGEKNRTAQGLRYSSDILEFGYEIASERLTKGEYGK
jgi:hypothetical protein